MYLTLFFKQKTSCWSSRTTGSFWNCFTRGLKLFIQANVLNEKFSIKPSIHQCVYYSTCVISSFFLCSILPDKGTGNAASSPWWPPQRHVHVFYENTQISINIQWIFFSWPERPTWVQCSQSCRKDWKQGNNANFYLVLRCFPVL